MMEYEINEGPNGGIEWPTEFDKFIFEEPKNADELIQSQTAWLAKTSAYIAMHLKRWWEKKVVSPFTNRMMQIRQPCEDLLNVLPARLPAFQQRFREKYEQMLSVAKKADEVGTGIINFKVSARDFYEIVMMIHSEALVALKASLAEKAAGKRGNATAATIINIDKLGVLGDVQAENVQTGDYSSIHKQPTIDKKAERWYQNRNLQATFIIILVTIAGWFLIPYINSRMRPNGNPKMRAPSMPQTPHGSSVRPNQTIQQEPVKVRKPQLIGGVVNEPNKELVEDIVNEPNKGRVK